MEGSRSRMNLLSSRPPYSQRSGANDLQFAVVHAGKYTVHEEKFEGLTIRVAPYAGIRDGQVQQLATLAQKSSPTSHGWDPFPSRSSTSSR